MTKKRMAEKSWPSFVTRDLGDSPEDDAEMLRRWQVYNAEMQVLIAAGGVHRDADGWWVDDATGDLIGPDPEIERPLTAAELATARPFAEACPELAESIQRSRGRPRIENPRQAVTLRLSPETVERFKKTGKDWRARMSAALEKAST
ncbi:BrnA antitoxin family protein [Xanthobacteraceae bacterium A53D]